MGVSSTSFGSPLRPGGRPPGSRNKLRPLREVFDELCIENFGSVEAGHKALAAHIWQNAFGSIKTGVKADFRYLQCMLLYWFGKPPEDLATQQKLEDANEELRLLNERRLPATGTEGCR